MRTDEPAGDEGSKGQPGLRADQRGAAPDSPHSPRIPAESLFESILGGFAYHEILFRDGVPFDFRYLFVNTNFERLTGLTGVVGRTITEVLPVLRETDQDLYQIYFRVAQTGVPERFERYVAAMRQWFVISVFSTDPGHFAVLFDNITRQKKIDLTQTFLATTVHSPEAPFLRATARFLSEILGMAYVCIDQIEGDGRIALTLANWAFEGFEDSLTYPLAGTPCGRAVADGFFSLVSGVKAAFPDDPLLRDLPVESYVGILLQSHTGDPLGVIAALGTTPLDDPATAEALLRLVAVRAGAELERLKTEAALFEKTMLLTQSNAELEQFAYVASHDLQTPLRNIILYSQLIEAHNRGRLDAETDEFIDFIVHNGKQMTRLIADLLDYSRINRKKTPLVPLPADEAVRQALINLRMEIDGSDAEIQLAPLPVVLAEYTQLVSLFQNLISNALKYRVPDRRLRIVVTAVRTDSDPWTVSVEDNGVGIEPQYFDKIFHIFQRLFPNDQIEGTGIGLALCRKIIQRFGGRIWVESIPGCGSKFCFTLQDGRAGRPS